jgi:hypothetical protein
MKTTIDKSQNIVSPRKKKCDRDDKICTETSMVFRPGDYCRENLKRKAL